jgi:hypothetical protein
MGIGASGHITPYGFGKGRWFNEFVKGCADLLHPFV